MNGTSIFDPVLCELAYRWFSPESGSILDPFAGGSVRGIVAAKLGRPYTGVDLRAEQVEANQMQWDDLEDEESPAPNWVNGDSLDIGQLVEGEFDMIFSCPPYADLEVYSEDPKDLSTMSYPDFKEVYSAIIKASVAKLKQDRFAVFVVGEVRQKGSGCSLLQRSNSNNNGRLFADPRAQAIFKRAQAGQDPPKHSCFLQGRPRSRDTGVRRAAIRRN